MDLTALFAVYAFMWGAVWGSFLNVVIYRLPRGLNLARPRSRCPVCDTQIGWRENIPLVSYWMLRRRCRSCKAPISARYFAVELLTALLSTYLFLRCAEGRFDVADPVPVLLTFALYFFFICAAIAVAFIDFELTVVPDIITIPTALLGVVAAIVLPKDGVWESFHPTVTWLDSTIGIGVGVGVILAIIVVYKSLTGRIGMGSGDATMLAMVGGFLGWQSLIFVLFFASVQGILVAVGAALTERIRGRPSELLLRGVHRQEFWEEREDGEPMPPELEEAPEAGDDDPSFGKTGVPFGPFISLAAIEYLFFGEWAERWLMGGM